MKLCIRKTGGSTVNMDQLTATRGDVAAGDKFYGAGSDGIQSGALVNNQDIQKKLGANEAYTVPSGIISPGSYVYQDIKQQGPMTISPVQAGSYAGVTGKYMTGNITVNGVNNLIPANIRKGAFIGSVAGTWEGYVNNDPLCPYWKGVFAPGQTGELMDNRPVTSTYVAESDIEWQKGNANPDGQYIDMSSWAPRSGATVYPAFRFSVPIEMAGVKSVSIMYRLPAHSANSYTWIVLSQDTDYYVAESNWSIRPGLGAYEKFVLPASDSWITKTFALSNAGRYKYIHVGIGVAPSTSQGRWIEVKYIRLNK